MQWKLLEVRPELVEREIGRIELFDIIRLDELGDIRLVACHDVEGAGRRAIDQRDHFLAAAVFLGNYLDLVLFLERTDDLGRSVPGIAKPRQRLPICSL